MSQTLDDALRNHERYGGSPDDSVIIVHPDEYGELEDSYRGYRVVRRPAARGHLYIPNESKIRADG